MKTLISILLVTLVLTPPVDRADQASTLEIKGRYVNREYGFSIELPSGVQGETLPPPAPQHGFRAKLRGSSGLLIVNAEYDAAFVGAGLADEWMASQIRQHPRLKLISRVPTQLGGLPATELVLADGGSDARLSYVRAVVAIRNRPQDVGIIYTVVLEQVVRSNSFDEAFASLLRSFQIQPRAR